MSINKLISVNNVLVDLLDELALDHTKYKPMFTNWAISAEKQIGSYYQYKRKHAVLTISGCVAEIPCDAEYLQIAIMGDLGCDCGDLFNRFCSFGLAQVTTGNINSVSFLTVDLPSSATSGNGFAGWGIIDNRVQDNKLIFDRNLDGQKVTIQYLGMESDENGIPYINQNNIEAIKEYCLWKFKRRNIKSGIDIGVCRDHEKLWREYAGRARGDSAEITDAERERILSELWNPFTGRGLRLVPTLGNYNFYGGSY